MMNSTFDWELPGANSGRDNLHDELSQSKRNGKHNSFSDESGVFLALSAKINFHVRNYLIPVDVMDVMADGQCISHE